MILINQSATILESQGSLKDIERAARLCYKSEDKISDDDSSAKKLVKFLIDKKHYAMLEFGQDIVLSLDHAELFLFTINLKTLPAFKALQFADGDYDETNVIINPRSALEIVEHLEANDVAREDSFNDKLYCTLRQKLGSFIDYTCVPPSCVLSCYTGPLGDKELVTVHIVTNRGVSHELVRHRIASFAQESTRYCNYGKEKFNGVTYIAPEWLDLKSYLNVPIDNYKLSDRLFFKGALGGKESCFMSRMLTNESAYLRSLSDGESAQQARGKLNNDVKTELLVKATLQEWQHIFKLRCAKDAHPQIQALMRPLRDQFAQKYPDLDWN